MANRLRVALILAPPGLYLFRAGVLINPLHATGLAGIAEWAFAVVLGCYFLVFVSSVGTAVLDRIDRADTFTLLERSLLAHALGSGLVGTAVMVLGFMHVIDRWPIIAILSGSGALIGRSSQRWIAGSSRVIQDGLRGLGAVANWRGLVLLGMLVSLVAAFLAALTPPVGYDALMYHLQGASQIFKSHGLSPDLNNWWNNYPFLVQMLFVIGFVFDADILARLINLGFGISIISLVFALARRIRPERDPWFAVACFIATPPLALWASFAYIDLANAVFVGLAALALLSWRTHGRPSLLLLAGTMTGLALASKYTAVIDAGLLMVVVAWLLHSKHVRGWVRDFAYMIGPALVLAGPWYAKNWIWLGSPIFPTMLPSHAPLPLRYQLNASYVQHGFGTGSGLGDVLGLPLQLYRNSLAFGQFALEMPSLMFVLLLLMPLAWRGVSKPLLLLVAVRFTLWAATTQQMRFLLTTFIPASLLTGDVIHSLLNRFSRTGQLALRGVVVAIVLAATAAGAARVWQSAPWGVLLGLESRDTFLATRLAGYRARSFVRDQLPESARLFLVGDGRRYYCPQQCDPVVDQFGWTRIAIEAGMRSDRALSDLCSLQFTHILLSWPDINYLLVHDPNGLFLESMRLLLSKEFIGGQQLVFEEEEAAVYRLACDAQ